MTHHSIKPRDIDVVDRIKQGDVNAFESLLLKYENHVLRIVKRHVPQHEIEETVHNVFIRVYESLSTFEAKSDFKAWVSAIAVRTCYDYWRKAYRSREIPLSSLTEKHQKWMEDVVWDQSRASFQDKGSQEEAREVLDWALAKLSAEERVVLELIYLEGLSVREAARLLGWSMANVKVRSFRSRRKLRKFLEAWVGGLGQAL